jgi:hypothetical protein
VRYSVAFDPEAFADICLDMLDEAGARLRLHTWFAAAPVSGGSIDVVIVESKRGREAIRPRVVIDATGDGDVFVSAGAGFEQVSIPPHLWFRVGGSSARLAEDEQQVRCTDLFVEPGTWLRGSRNSVSSKCSKDLTVHRLKQFPIEEAGNTLRS